MTLDAHTDDAARALIREALDQTLFVEASAGTGKTSALVERYVALVLAGHPVERLVAITFTERPRQSYETACAASWSVAPRTSMPPPPTVSPAPWQPRRRADQHDPRLLLNLLRAFAVNAGIDPTFTVQDEVAADRRFDERWRSYLEDLGSDATARDRLSRMLDLGLWPNDLQKLAKELFNHRSWRSACRPRPSRRRGGGPDVEACAAPFWTATRSGSSRGQPAQRARRPPRLPR